MHTPKRSLTKAALRGVAALACLSSINAYAITKVEVMVESLTSSDGPWFTPVFFGFHDGTSGADNFDAGGSASAELEALAEGGDTSGLTANLTAVAGSLSHTLLGSFGPPGVLFMPGSSESFMIDLDETMNRYLSFASMIIPSNDAFMGNEDETAHALFDGSGNFNSGFQIDILGGNIWDGGTELNDGMGAAFSALGGVSTDTTDPIALHAGLDNFIGTGIGSGGLLGSAFDSTTPVARITVRRVPDSTAHIGAMGILALFAFRFVSRKRMGTK